MYVLVNPVSTGPALVDAFVEEGADVVRVYDESHRGAAVPHCGPPALVLDDLEHTVDELRKLKPVAVIAGSEFGVTLADDLASRLDLPHQDPSTTTARRDKQIMAEALRSVGLRAPWTAAVTTERQLSDVLVEHPGERVVVKPRHGAGSDGCTVAESARAALDAFRSIVRRRNLMGLMNDDVLVQEYLAGTQYIVNTVSAHGRHLLSEIYGERIDVLDGAPVLRHIESRRTLDDREIELVDYVRGCLDAIGVREGAAHTEVMLTPDGPCLVEVNSRIMGPSLAPDPYHAAFGYSHQHLVAERFLRPDEFSRRFDLPYAPARHVAKIFLRSRQAGPLRAVDGVRVLRRLPGFHSVDRLPHIGVPIPDRYLTTGSAGIAYLVHEDIELLRHSLDVVHDLEDADRFYRIDELS